MPEPDPIFASSVVRDKVRFAWRKGDEACKALRVALRFEHDAERRKFLGDLLDGMNPLVDKLRELR